MLEPLVVRQGNNGDWRVVAGNRRLAENTTRVAMHPADQALTFKRLIDEGASHEDVTHRFGLATRTVERRVRFAHLAPPILEAFRAGTKGRRGATYGRFD